MRVLVGDVMGVSAGGNTADSSVAGNSAAGGAMAFGAHEAAKNKSRVPKTARWDNLIFF